VSIRGFIFSSLLGALGVLANLAQVFMMMVLPIHGGVAQKAIAERNIASL
jgi:hypothetical protein